MSDYLNGFLLPIPRKHLDEYKKVAEQVAEIWKEHGATAYFEFVGDELTTEGLKSFADLIDAREDEIVIFGWAVFPSKEIRDRATKQVPADPRMGDLIAPLINPEKMIFKPGRMAYGGFKKLVG
jgi:uncharacterized protein YbaA (DUF1428 family)